MNTILMTAYDINPYKGSESATGWNFTLQIARFNKVIAVTRKNNRESIEQYIKEFDVDISNIQFYYYDFPYYLRFWKRGARGSSLYFYLWQMFMPLFVKINKIEFDIAHNVNFHADAFPTFLWLLGKPTVWGPINHNESIPKQYLSARKDYVKDRLKWVIKTINWNLDPFLQLAKTNVDMIIGGNSSVQKRLKVRSDKFVAMTQVASNRLKYTTTAKKEDTFNVLVVGRFLTIKSFDLALNSFENFYNKLSTRGREKVKLTIIGQGPLEGSLKNIVKGLTSKHNIEFVGWIEKNTMNTYYEQASMFLFPSHEGAGMVVVEAMSHGLPVICFDNYGAGEFVDDTCSIKIPYTDLEQTIADYSSALLCLFQDKELLSKMSYAAKNVFEEKFTWNRKGDAINLIYKRLG
jgi:glycosyltransferase involved in cell wall biosynthesis